MWRLRINTYTHGFIDRQFLCMLVLSTAAPSMLSGTSKTRERPGELTSTAAAACAGCTLGLRQKSIHGQQLHGVDVKLVPRCIRGRHHSFLHLDGEVLQGHANTSAPS